MTRKSMFSGTMKPVVRRRDGMCWCCCSYTRVRLRKIWLNGEIKLFCKDCEEQVALCTPPIPWPKDDA